MSENRIRNMIEEMGMLHENELYELGEEIVRECATLVKNLGAKASEELILEHFGFKTQRKRWEL